MNIIDNKSDEEVCSKSTLKIHSAPPPLFLTFL